MLVPGLAILAVFHYYPMYGIVIAFQDFNPGKGFTKSPWVGLANFQYILGNPDFYNILRNSFVISALKIITMQISAVILALLLNEVRMMWFKRTLADHRLPAALSVLDRAGRHSARYAGQQRHYFPVVQGVWASSPPCSWAATNGSCPPWW